MLNLKSFASVCRPDSGWAAFFTSILVWGVGMGCFQAVFNNFITVFYALFGGWVFDRYGAGALLATAGVMALANSAFALTVPKPVKRAAV